MADMVRVPAVHPSQGEVVVVLEADAVTIVVVHHPEKRTGVMDSRGAVEVHLHDDLTVLDR